MLLPDKPFQPSLMIVGKGSNLTVSGASEKCFTQIGTGLAEEKHTSLLWKFVLRMLKVL
jgi:hypothetical protein